MAAPRQSRTASTCPVLPTRLVSVEHPAIIRNLDKALDTLQGNAGINDFMNPAKADDPAKLTLRPEDAMARPLLSTSSPSNNVLLKVTMPKRTGRKRKRGTDEPFTDATQENVDPQRRSSKDLLRSLQDNPSRYQIETVGKVERTHVFRGLPGFVYSTTNSSFTQKFRDQILPYDLEKLKQFDIDMAKGAMENADIIPPPSLSNEQVAFTYMYRQNPGVKQLRDASGQLITTNTQRAEKVRTHLLAHDIPEVPSQPQEGLPPIESLDPALQATIKLVADLFEHRPAWTRRAIRNFLQTDEQRYLLRLAVPYVGYIFRSGPWRDAIIKLGLDPRKDPQFRHYQTFMFRLIPREPEIARDGAARRGGRFTARFDPDDADPYQGRNTYIFTGDMPLHTDGRIWMVCDIADPYVRDLLYPPESVDPATYLRETCDAVCDGWYANGLLAKVKIIMRTKISSLIEGIQPSNEDFFQIVNLPNFASSDADLQEIFQLDPRTSTTKEIGLATEVRAAIKSAPTWVRGIRDEPVSPEKKGKRAKIDDAAKPDKQATEIDQDVFDEQSEGEEEEMERAEMVADILAAHEAAENQANIEGYQDQDDDEGDEDEEDEDEDDDSDDDSDDEDEDDDEDDF